MTCFWNSDGHCRDPVVGNSAATPERCSSCSRYRGPTRGLGDIVHITAKVTGVNYIAKKTSELTGFDCGCDRRRAQLNQAFPASPDPSK